MASEITYECRLSTDLPLYQPSALSLKTLVRTQPVGQRPLIELEPTDHPLAVEQRTGIMLVRVQEIAERLLHALPAPRSRQGLSSGDLRTQKRAIGAQTRTARRECDSARIRRYTRSAPLDACGVVDLHPRLGSTVWAEWLPEYTTPLALASEFSLDASAR